MFELPATTCRLVATRPSLLTTKPVPSDCSVRTDTTDGVDRAAISAGVRIEAGLGDESFCAWPGSAPGATAGFALQDKRPRRQMPMSVGRMVRKGPQRSLRYPPNRAPSTRLGLECDVARLCVGISVMEATLLPCEWPREEEAEA